MHIKLHFLMFLGKFVFFFFLGNIIHFFFYKNFLKKKFFFSKNKKMFFDFLKRNLHIIFVCQRNINVLIVLAKLFFIPILSNNNCSNWETYNLTVTIINDFLIFIYVISYFFINKYYYQIP